MNNFEDLLERYPALDECLDAINTARDAIIRVFENNGTLLVCGNGGSYCDAEHIAGELMKGFHKKRPLSGELKKNLVDFGGELGVRLSEGLQQPLRTISLIGMPALSTAVTNDITPEFAFAQQVMAFADDNSVFWGISTSGDACNVIAAAVTAKSLGAYTIGLTGAVGGKMNGLFDVVIKVPETETFKIQELHLPVYHAICLSVEEYFFED